MLRRLLRLLGVTVLATSTFGDAQLALRGTKNSPMDIIPPTSPKLKLELIFRAFCPACQWILQQGVFQQLVTHPELSPLVDLYVYPSGGMTVAGEALQCEGGIEECAGHRYYACVMDLLVEPARYLPLLACMERDQLAGETTFDWKKRLTDCVHVVPTPVFSVDSLVECATNPSISQALLLPSIERDKEIFCTSFPFVVLNNKEVEGELLRNADGSTSNGIVSAKELNAAVCLALPPTTRQGLKVCAPSRVNVKILWRAFCPACKWYISDPILKLVTDPAFAAIIDMELLPVAGMKADKMATTPDLAYTCTSGERECIGHRYFACAVDKFDLQKAVEILACLETTPGGHNDYDSTATKCTRSTADSDLLRTCANKSSGALLTTMIQNLPSDLKIRWMPYTVVNHDNVLGSASAGVSLSELKTAICAAFKGPKELLPTACVPVPKSVANVQAPKAEAPNVHEDTKTNNVETLKLTVSESGEVEESPPMKPCAMKKGGATYDDPPDVGPRSLLGVGAASLNHPKSKSNHPNLSSSSSNAFLMVVGGILLVGAVWYGVVALQKSKQQSFHKSK